MKKLFAEYEEALALKGLGFDEPCFARFINKEFRFATLGGMTNFTKDFSNQISAPLYTQAFEFFRNKYKLSCSIELTDDSRHYYYDFTIYDSEDRDYNDEDCFDSCKRLYCDGTYSTYEEAELECLKKLIGIVKNK